ncbi:coproporphyrinogen III oxidase [Pedobacter nyackensis]|uniref:coproporphyrinogen III oxidase n=1 Tax=Pedobacter nyackensis TaxID=475255 RepID=UPI002930BFB7|nr:coproporphyrinogen III oxidase [Pedobacter nyackensis]
MKKLILSIAAVATFVLAISACNSTKNVSGSSDTLKVDTNISVPVDTPKVIDTLKPTPPDTTMKPPVN